MKRVIDKTLTKGVVDAKETKEFKLYVLETDHNLYMLHGLLNKDPDRSTWAWLSILNPKVYCGRPYFGFYTAMRCALIEGTVHELDGITDLIEFLKDREEAFIDKV